MDDLWAQLKNRREQAIEGLCDSETPESQTLEFKSTSTAKPILNKEDKQNLGSSLSAFSNATGGILIWGIAPDKGSDGAASVGKPEPIPDIVGFTDRVHALLGTIISPGNPHIDVLPIKRDDGSGYLAIQVKQSEVRPHMSLAPNHHRYYLRQGSSTLPMEDFQVRDMLQMRTGPKLILSAYVEAGGASPPNADVRLVFNIGNEGRVSAKSVYLSAPRSKAGAWKAAVPASASEAVVFTKRTTSQRLCSEAPALSLHPGQDIDAAALILVVQTSMPLVFWYKNYTAETAPCADTDFSVSCEIGCEDMIAQKVELLIPADAFNEAIERVALKGEKRVDVDARYIEHLP